MRRECGTVIIVDVIPKGKGISKERTAVSEPKESLTCNWSTSHETVKEENLTVDHSEVEAMLYRQHSHPGSGRGSGMSTQASFAPLIELRVSTRIVKECPQPRLSNVKAFSPGGGLRMQVRGSATCLGTKQGRISDSHLQFQSLSRQLAIEDYKNDLHSDPSRQRRNVDRCLPLERHLT